MKTFDLAAMCLRNLLRRKFRTMLTVIGVVIGTCAIVVMISLGIAISASQDELISSYGDLTVIQVWGYDPQNPLDDTVLTNIQAIDGVDTATPFMQYYEAYSMAILAGPRGRYAMRSYYNINGVYPDAVKKLGYELLQGEYFPDTNPTKKIQLLLGENAAYQFEDTKKSWQNSFVSPYPDEFGNIPDPFFDPLKTEMTIELIAMDGNTEKKLVYEVEILGIMKGDPSRNYATMEGAFMSIKDMKRIQDDYNKLLGKKPVSGSRGSSNTYQGYNQVYVKADNINNVVAVEKAIHELGFTDTYSRESERQQMQASARRIQMILGGLGAISLLVAAISITNTMIMSVYERTREIGVMKVLGCPVGNIRTIFLLEAGIIGFMGGIIGNLISYLLSFIMNTFGSAMAGGGLGGIFGGFGMMGGSKISIIPPWLMLLGLIFATLIGLVSGFYPANRAVKISALEAIKQE